MIPDLNSSTVITSLSPSSLHVCTANRSSLSVLSWGCFKFLVININYWNNDLTGRPVPRACGGVWGRGRQETWHMSVPLRRTGASGGFWTNKTPSPSATRPTSLLTRFYITTSKTRTCLSWPGTASGENVLWCAGQEFWAMLDPSNHELKTRVNKKRQTPLSDSREEADEAENNDHSEWWEKATVSFAHTVFTVSCWWIFILQSAAGVYATDVNMYNLSSKCQI